MAQLRQRDRGFVFLIAALLVLGPVLVMILPDEYVIGAFIVGSLLDIVILITATLAFRQRYLRNLKILESQSEYAEHHR